MTELQNILNMTVDSRLIPFYTPPTGSAIPATIPRNPKISYLGFGMIGKSIHILNIHPQKLIIIFKKLHLHINHYTSKSEV